MPEIAIDDRIVEILSDHAARVVVSTGAGVSAESGVPTFRDEDGLWSQFRPEDLATPAAFRENPQRVWKWYEWRRGIIRAIDPNPGHIELARWQRLFPNLTLITQNVDGLHRRAGSSEVIELHGNIMLSCCLLCGEDAGGAGPGTDGGSPMCHCGGQVRPSVVWFGEPLPEAALQQAWEASESAEVFFSVGTSGLVQPAASLAFVAKKAGAFLVEINPEVTEISGIFDLVLRGPSGVILPELGQRLK
jgi:NAD-dependent deacetylase